MLNFSTATHEMGFYYIRAEAEHVYQPCKCLPLFYFYPSTIIFSEKLQWRDN